MVKHFSRRSNITQLYHHHGDFGWTILWNTRKPDVGERWSIANEGTEEAAISRAKHLVRLGFVVYAIKDPSGSVILDEKQIAERFVPAHVA